MAAKAAMAQQAQTPASSAAAAAQQAPIPPPRVPLAPGPVPWMEGLMELKPLPIVPVVPDAIAESKKHFFTETQLATLRRFCQLLMPPLEGHPGAMEAGTPEFLDFLIGISPPDRQEMYRTGLDRLEAEAKAKFGLAFDHAKDEQADKIIRPWLRAWMPDHPPAEQFARFINIAHSDIRFATENSQAWSDAELDAGMAGPQMDAYWYPVDPDMKRESEQTAARIADNKAHA